MKCKDCVAAYFDGSEEAALKDSLDVVTRRKAGNLVMVEMDPEVPNRDAYTLLHDDPNAVVELVVYIPKATLAQWREAGHVTASTSEAASSSNYMVILQGSEHQHVKLYASKTAPEVFSELTAIGSSSSSADDAVFNNASTTATASNNSTSDVLAVRLVSNLHDFVKVNRPRLLADTVEKMRDVNIKAIVNAVLPFALTIDYDTFLKYDCMVAVRSAAPQFGNLVADVVSVHEKLLADSKDAVKAAVENGLLAPEGSSAPNLTDSPFSDDTTQSKRFISFETFKARLTSMSIGQFFGKDGLYPTATTMARSSGFLHSFYVDNSTAAYAFARWMSIVCTLSAAGMIVALLFLGQTCFLNIDWKDLSAARKEMGKPSPVVAKQLEMTQLLTCAIVIPSFIIAFASRQNHIVAFNETQTVNNGHAAVIALETASRTLFFNKSSFVAQGPSRAALIANPSPNQGQQSPRQQKDVAALIKGEEYSIARAVEGLSPAQLKSAIDVEAVPEEELMLVYSQLVKGVERVEMCNSIVANTNDYISFPYMELVTNVIVAGLTLYVFVYLIGKLDLVQLVKDVRCLHATRNKVEKYMEFTKVDVDFVRELDSNDIDNELAMLGMGILGIATLVFVTAFASEAHSYKSGLMSSRQAAAGTCF